MKGYSFLAEPDSGVAKDLCELIRLSDKRKYIVRDLDMREWTVFISFTSGNAPTSAFCEAHGTPAKVHLVVNLDLQAPDMYTWGCFYKGIHKLERVQGKVVPIYESLKSKLLSIAWKYDELLEVTSELNECE